MSGQPAGHRVSENTEIQAPRQLVCSDATPGGGATASPKLVFLGICYRGAEI